MNAKRTVVPPRSVLPEGWEEYHCMTNQTVGRSVPWAGPCLAKPLPAAAGRALVVAH